MQIINTDNPLADIEQGENTVTVISDIEEEDEEVEEETFEEELTEETALQHGSVNEEIGMKNQGKKKDNMVRASSGTAEDTPSVEDGIKDKSKQRDTPHRPRKETFTMDAERKDEAKTPGWSLSMKQYLELPCMILYRVGNQLEHKAVKDQDKKESTEIKWKRIFLNKKF